MTKISMTEGSARILASVLAEKPELAMVIHESVRQRIADSNGADNVEMSFAESHRGGTVHGFLECEKGEWTLGMSVMLKVWALDSMSMSICHVPEVIVADHMAKVEPGLRARDVIDVDILEGVGVIRVVPAEGDVIETTYILGAPWSVLSHELREGRPCIAD